MRKSKQIPNMVIVIFLLASTSAVRCLYSSETPIRPDSPKSSLENEQEKIQAALKRLQLPEVRRERQLLDDLNRAMEKYYQCKDEPSRKKYESLYEQALAMPKPSAAVYSACATAANLLGQPRQAIAILKKAIADYPDIRVWGPIVPLKISGYYRIGSIATRIGDSNAAIFAYETIINNCQDLESAEFHKVMSLMFLADIAAKLLNDKQLAAKRLREMIEAIESIDTSTLQHEDNRNPDFLRGWALYELERLETGTATSRHKSDLRKEQYTLPYMLAMTHVTMSYCTMHEIEQAAQDDSFSIDSILTKFGLAFNYTHHANLNPPKAEKYLQGIIKNDAYFKVYAEAILEFVHEQRDEINKKIPILLQELKQGDLKQRESAAFNLCRQTGPEGIKVLQQAQQDPNKYVRYTAACNLARWGRDASIQPDFNIVLETFTDNEPLIRRQAQGAISYRNCLKIGSKEIVDLIRLNDEYYSKELISPIESFLSNSHTTQEIIEVAVPELAKLMSHPNPEVRNSVIDILRRIRHSIADAVPALVGCLDKQDLEMQKRIIGLLGRIGPVAKEAIPKITAYTKHKNVNIRNEALNALRKISPDRIE